MKHVADYPDHYLKKDVFEKFIGTCLKFYGLDPCHYFSSPGLSWDAMLKMRQNQKTYRTLTSTYLLKKELRGGISYIAKRHAKANNKYMKVYDSKEPSQFITYLDLNNLYGWGMSGYLPYGGFKWLKNSDGFDVTLIGKEKSNRLHSRG